MRATLGIVTLFTVLASAAAQEIPADALSPTLANEAKGVLWFDALLLPFEGRPYSDTNSPFDRLPSNMEGIVEPYVWQLGKQSSGMAVRFITNAKQFEARWSLTKEQLGMTHMPATGVSGLDLYIREGDSYRWAGVGRPARQIGASEMFLDFAEMAPREYILYLPLYNGVQSLEIGIPSGAYIAPAPPRPAARTKPVVFYGTSITQGACASRPGAAYTAIISRALDRSHINLGFSGNGKMYPEFVDLLARIDAECYVIDCVPNMTPELVDERAAGFLRGLRAAKPTTPIIVVESLLPPHRAYNESRANYPERNARLRAAYEQVVQPNEPWFYVRGDDLIGNDGEGTADGIHPSDLGFMRISEELIPVIEQALAH